MLENFIFANHLDKRKYIELNTIAIYARRLPFYVEFMHCRSVLKRIEPIGQKLTGQLPLCPWVAILERLDSRMLSAYPPPVNIRVIAFPPVYL